MKIDLNIENNTTHKIPAKKFIEQSILDVFKEKSFDIHAEVGLKVVEKPEIKKLNAKYRQKDTVTDVLSFPIFGKPPQTSESVLLLGDIIICYDVMAQNAETYNLSIGAEFLKLISHSTLHLLGFHHA